MPYCNRRTRPRHPPGKLASMPSRPRKNLQHVREMYRAAQRERDAALEAVERIELLPWLHISALLGVAAETQGWQGAAVAQSLPELRAGLNGPLSLFYYEKVPGSRYTVDRLATVAGNLLARVAPPEELVSQAGWRLVCGDEDEIREAAKEAAMRGRVALDVALHFGDTVTPEHRERACIRWWTRHLRREALAAQAYADLAFRVARPGSPFVSRYTLDAFHQRQENAAAWAKATVACSDTGAEIPMPELIRSKHAARLSRNFMPPRRGWNGPGNVPTTCPSS